LLENTKHNLTWADRKVVLSVWLKEDTMRRGLIFLLVGILLAGCSVSPTQALTSTPIPTKAPTPTSTYKPIPAPTNTPASSINHIYAFGDSLSDIGHDGAIAKGLAAEGKFPSEFVKIFETYYWKGRDSNGPAAVEVLADRLKVGLTDYAVGGAKTGYDNANGDLWDNTGLMAQIDQFEAELKGERADANSLYFIHISANDFIGSIDGVTHNISATVPLADQALANLNLAVEHLAKLGAHQFMVGTSTDLSGMPGIINSDYGNEALAFQTRFNSGLPGEMEKLAERFDLKMNIFDYTALSDRIHSSPGDYGLTNTVDSCLVVNDSTTTVCKNPDEYFYWDDVHPTRRVHQIMGEAMAAQLSK
jgi:cholinesterase